MSILMFLRFGQIIGKIGFVGILGKLFSHIRPFVNLNKDSRTSSYSLLH
jgi:hypothetical protein